MLTIWLLLDIPSNDNEYARSAESRIAVPLDLGQTKTTHTLVSPPKCYASQICACIGFDTKEFRGRGGLGHDKLWKKCRGKTSRNSNILKEGTFKRILPSKFK